jgi:hypothetical protein
MRVGAREFCMDCSGKRWLDVAELREWLRALPSHAIENVLYIYTKRMARQEGAGGGDRASSPTKQAGEG